MTLIQHPNGYKAEPKFNDKDQISELALNMPDGSNVLFKRDGEVLKPVEMSGNMRWEPISKLEMRANGNTHFADANGHEVIIRGNGVLLPVGASNYRVEFDQNGDVLEIAPAKEVQVPPEGKGGARVRSFPRLGPKQINDDGTEELKAVKFTAPDVRSWNSNNN